MPLIWDSFPRTNDMNPPLKLDCAADQMLPSTARSRDQRPSR